MSSASSAEAVCGRVSEIPGGTSRVVGRAFLPAANRRARAFLPPEPIRVRSAEGKQIQWSAARGRSI
jgi:hypothetical protein